MIFCSIFGRRRRIPWCIWLCFWCKWWQVRWLIFWCLQLIEKIFCMLLCTHWELLFEEAMCLSLLSSFHTFFYLSENPVLLWRNPFVKWQILNYLMLKLFIQKQLRYQFQTLSVINQRWNLSCICKYGNALFAGWNKVNSLHSNYPTFTAAPYQNTRETTNFHQFVVHYAQLYWQGIEQDSDACMLFFNLTDCLGGKSNLFNSRCRIELRMSKKLCWYPRGHNNYKENK